MSEENKQVAISIHFKTKEQLYKAYMPFIKGGGLFIPMAQEYSMGEEVKLLLKLLDEAEQFQLETKVAWITPPAAQDGRKTGVGLQLLGETGEEIKAKIDRYLAGMKDSAEKTETM